MTQLSADAAEFSTVHTLEEVVVDVFTTYCPEAQTPVQPQQPVI